jgi:acetyl-CoA acyltransferase
VGGGIGHFEVRETFTAVPLAWRTEFDINPDLLNPRAGAVMLGHLPAASCARMDDHHPHRAGGHRRPVGLQVMGVAGGLATVCIIERL